MNLKMLLIDIISADQRIRDYEKDPSEDNAHRCIKAHKEAIIEFCKKFEENTVTVKTYQDKTTDIHRLKCYFCGEGTNTSVRTQSVGKQIEVCERKLCINKYVDLTNNGFIL